MKKIAWILGVFLALSLSLFAQRTATVTPTSYNLTISANIQSRVTIYGIDNKQSYQGTTSFTQSLPPGNYRITVEADGYISQTRDINLGANMTENFSLQPATGRVEIIMGGQFLNMKVTDPRSLIDIYDNGSLVEGNGFILTLRPGQHTIQIVSGGLMAQATIRVEAGRTYILEPHFTLELR